MKTSSCKVILTGAGGTGKTLLAEGLSQLLKLPIIPELARRLCAQMGHDNIGQIADQEGFKWQVLEAQIAEENKLPGFISDRSTIDCWVLWQRWNMCSAMTYDSESYYQKSREQAACYTQIVYIPPMFAPVDDGFRWVDPDYQRQIDRLIRMTLYEWGLWDRTYTVRCRELPERIDEVGEILRKR